MEESIMSQLSYLKIQVGDQEKLMKYDYNAIADLEDMYNMGLFELLSEEKIGLRTIRALYWAGLKWKEPKLTLAQAGKYIEIMLEETEMEDLIQPVYKALARAKFIQSLGINFEEVKEEEDDTEKN
jgi:hypothetical protein